MRSPFSRLYFILEGEGLARIGEKTLRLRAGSIYLIPCGDGFFLSCEAHMEQLFFHVNVNGQNGMDYFRDCRRLLEREGNPERIGLIRRLYRSEGAADAFRPEGDDLGGAGRLRAGRGAPGAVGAELFRAGQPVLFSCPEPGQRRQSDQRACGGASCFAKARFPNASAGETGITPGAYLNRLVLDRACRLLLSGEMSIAEGSGTARLFRPVLFYQIFQTADEHDPERLSES